MAPAGSENRMPANGLSGRAGWLVGMLLAHLHLPGRPDQKRLSVFLTLA
jgi:hypothetical protein